MTTQHDQHTPQDQAMPVPHIMPREHYEKLAARAHYEREVEKACSEQA